MLVWPSHLRSFSMPPLLFVAHVAGAFEIFDRRTLRLECGPLIDARQKASAPVLSMSLGNAAAERIVHHDERGQILALGAETVSTPGAETRKTHAGHAG